MTHPERVLVAGCGYVGGRLAELLAEEGRTVFGLKRNPSTVPAGVAGLAADVSDPGTLRELPPSLDAVVYAVSPAGRDEAAYRTAYVEGPRNVLRAIGWEGAVRGREAGAAGGREAGRVAHRFILVSSTGVYGQRDGRRVDEDTEPEPADATGRVLLEGEGAAGAVEGTGIVLRLGGIYGPGRDRIARRVLAGEADCPAPDHYGNRIHRDDAAAALRHLLDLDDPAPVYIGVDRDPAPLRDVYRWIADRGRAPDPCRRETPETWEASGRRGTNKRCSSDRLAGSGFDFEYPSFREGYGPMIDALRESS